ncbi:MAG: EAL domain-containing protein [Alphaproteobacteria bacterium]
MPSRWSPYNPAVRAETDLLDCAVRLSRLENVHRRSAFHFHLSRLQPSRRQEHHLRLATAVFDSLLLRYECRLFKLGNDDLVLVTKDTPLLETDAVLAKLRGMFADDPLVYSGANGEGFMTVFDISADPAGFLVRCEAILGDAEARTRGAPSHRPSFPFRGERPLDMHGLAMLDAALAERPIGPFLRQQPVSAVSRDGALETVFTEILVSVRELQRALAPSADLKADSWLFLALSRLLDRRVVGHLDAAKSFKLPRPMSLNLCLSGLDDGLLATLARLQERLVDSRLIVETPCLEAYVDMTGFIAKCTRLRDMGFRLCLDGIDHGILPLIDRERLRVDFLKVRWNPLLEREGIAAPMLRLRQAVERSGTDRVVLARCDSPAALDWGRALGITLFQGRYVDLLHQREDERAAAPPPRAAASRLFMR